MAFAWDASRGGRSEEEAPLTSSRPALPRRAATVQVGGAVDGVGRGLPPRSGILYYVILYYCYCNFWWGVAAEVRTGASNGTAEAWKVVAP